MEWTMLKSVSSLFTNSCVSLPRNQELHRSTRQCLFPAWVCKASAAQENPVADWRTTNPGMAAWMFPNLLNCLRSWTVSPLSTLSHGHCRKKITPTSMTGRFISMPSATALILSPNSSFPIANFPTKILPMSNSLDTLLYNKIMTTKLQLLLFLYTLLWVNDGNRFICFSSIFIV